MTVPDTESVSLVTRLDDKIPLTPFNYGVNCYPSELRINSAMIYSITATSEGLFASAQGCLCLLDAIIIGLHSVFAHIIEPSIVSIVRFPAQIPLSPSQMHRKVNNDVSSILWPHLRVLFPPLGRLVAVLDGCTVGTVWELLTLLWDGWGLLSKSCVWFKRNTRCGTVSSPDVRNHISRLRIHVAPGGCARWRLGHFVFVIEQNSGHA